MKMTPVLISILFLLAACSKSQGATSEVQEDDTSEVSLPEDTTPSEDSDSAGIPSSGTPTEN